MPPTSNRAGALASIATALLDISSTSTEYNFSMDKATLIDGPFYDWVDDSLETQAFIEAGESFHAQDTHDGLWLSTLEVFVTVIRKYGSSYDDPTERDDEQPSSVRSKLFRDVTKKMLENWTRGGYARDTRLVRDGEVLFEDNNIMQEIVGHELMFEVDLEWDVESP